MSSDDLPIELRGLMARDGAEVARVWFESWRSTGLADGASVERLAERLTRERWAVTVAWSKSEIVGFVAFERDIRWLRQLFVKPHLKRSGVGAALLGAARAAMPDGFWLRTQIRNGPARRFYERAGLRLAGEEPHPGTGEMVARYIWDGRDPH